ncbi:beta-propeller domain-containing protein [uncultured Paraglaciecola sp.]|uniref:beta-propeller domain-containing protein n=1 Tax=uncultured Paraglaciecola sp. TaxID=1765024 RepID=UPI00262392BA|nr:beta-propeller domain-containing protein [uncultured Paraglaciecola sp.]
MPFIPVIFLLAACSGDSTQVADEPPIRIDPVIERPTEPPLVNSATAFDGPLVKADQASASRFIKNGIYSATLNYVNSFKDEGANPTATQDSSSATGDFSTTNTQESGVDEADRIEYDGQTLYLAAYPQWHGETTEPAKIRVLNRQDDFSLESMAELPVLEKDSHIEGMYQHNDRLAVLSTTAQFYAVDILFAPTPWIPSDQKLSLDIYNTAIPSNPSTVSNIKIDGNMISSRRIGDAVYLVTSYTAYVDGLKLDAITDAEILANYLTILNTPDSQLMPKIYRDGDQGTPLHGIEECVIPSQATDKDGYAQLLSITRISLTDPNDYQSRCISSVAEMVYMSEVNLYLGSSVTEETILHKVSLDQNLTYQATGKAQGIIGWRSAPNLRLSEKDGYLRIVSTTYSKQGPEHKLSILNQQGGELKVVATLPNEGSPEPIGKPGEDIYAVRFLGDRAYIVTFERIDPLYVIDLANPNAPSVLGALEIPGFSNYLHPLDNGYLLGVGQQVNVNNIPEDGRVTIQPVIQEGMKVSLFDVTDPSHPVEVNSLVKLGGYTPVEYDYRALTVLNTDGNYKFALPTESWNFRANDREGAWVSSFSLMLLEVDTRSNSPELIKRSEIRPSLQTESYVNGAQDRSVIHGDNVYYIHGNHVWQSTWAEKAAVFGPY